MHGRRRLFIGMKRSGIFICFFGYYYTPNGGERATVFCHALVIRM